MPKFEMTNEQESRFVGNILATFIKATQQEIDDGINWYANANQACKAIANNYEVPFAVAVAVVAALSPNNRWSRNLHDAELLISAYMDGEAPETVKVCTYNTMRAKAWDILRMAQGWQGLANDDMLPPMTVRASHIEDLRRVLKGQKITCFFDNIMGVDTCTIDGHARNIAYGERLSLSGGKFTISKSEYAALQECYRHAANVLSMSEDRRIPGSIKAYELQAITWVAWRRIWGI